MRWPLLATVGGFAFPRSPLTNATAPSTTDANSGRRRAHGIEYPSVVPWDLDRRASSTSDAPANTSGLRGQLALCLLHRRRSGFRLGEWSRLDRHGGGFAVIVI